MTTLPSSEHLNNFTDLDESGEAQALQQAMENLRNELATEHTIAEAKGLRVRVTACQALSAKGLDHYVAIKSCHVLFVFELPRCNSAMSLKCRKEPSDVISISMSDMCQKHLETPSVRDIEKRFLCCLFRPHTELPGPTTYLCTFEAKAADLGGRTRTIPQAMRRANRSRIGLEEAADSERLCSGKSEAENSDL